MPRPLRSIEKEPLSALSFLGRPASVSLAIFLGFAVLLVSATFYYASYSGALRWILFAVVLTALAYAAVRHVAARAADPGLLGNVAGARRTIEGELGDLRRTVERADRGLTYSQAVFEDRMRVAFLTKVRSNRRLTPAAVDAANDPERLPEIVKDAHLTQFVLEAERNARAGARRSSLPRKDFAKHAARTLDAMEAWR